MAVSMNAGFMRSDYMISDAALPMRIEELEQLEQTAKFSEILGEIGNATAKADKAMTAEEQPVVTEVTADGESAPMLSKAELKALAKAVVSGEMKLQEIPEELVTDVLLTVIAMMMLGVPEDEIPALEQYSEETQPVQLDVDTAEAFISVVKEHENSELTPDIAKELVQQTAQLEIPKEMKQEFAEQVEVVVYTMNEAAANTAVPEMTSEVTRSYDPQTAELPVEVEATAAVTEQAVTQSAPMQHGDSNEQRNAQQSATQQSVTQHPDAQAARAVQTADPAEQTRLDEEFRQLKKVITDYTVKKSEPEQTSYNTQQTAVVESNTKNRLVVKSDELMMLKNAAKPVTEAEVTAQPADMPQTMAAQLPVVFTRTDGTEIAVKPEEIIQQVTANIIEQATTVSEDGETEYSLTLNPEDLGSITVKLTKAVDGSLSVSIMAENARTQRIIDQNSAAIQQGLRQNGIELENWQTVTESQHENRAEDYNGSSKNPYYNEADNSENVDEEDNSFAELISAM